MFVEYASDESSNNKNSSSKQVTDVSEYYFCIKTHQLNTPGMIINVSWKGTNTFGIIKIFRLHFVGFKFWVIYQSFTYLIKLQNSK